MRQLVRSIAGAALFLAVSVPCFAGIHYKSVTKTQGDAAAQNSDIQVEGWVAGDNAKVTFVESSGNPVLQKGSYLVTKDGGKTLLLVNPEEKTYAEWSLQGMLGTVGAIMNGMGPLLKIQFSEPKVEKLLEEDGGAIVGLPTRHYKTRTSYTMTVRVLGMGNTTDVVSEQDIWATSKLQDVGLGVWLRAEPPRTGNADFDKMIAAGAVKFQGFPLKMVTVNTSTAKKGNRTTTTRSTMEVTQLDTNAAVPASAFEIPAGYEKTEIMPMPARPQ
ncbi:MAG TPA: DUF4412 domain-containing protein [Thermoanaerobaculia bacterium]|nr:DUF4412 domain-containing protein [Thermoanaerobaculia bacterium]